MEAIDYLLTLQSLTTRSAVDCAAGTLCAHVKLTSTNTLALDDESTADLPRFPLRRRSQKESAEVSRANSHFEL